MENSEQNAMPPAEMEPTRMLADIEPGMDVVTRDGNKLGQVSNVYRPVGVDEIDSLSHEATIQVGGVGLLGLGDDLYVPSSVVRAIESGRVVLDVDKNVVPDMPWHKPETLPDSE